MAGAGEGVIAEKVSTGTDASPSLTAIAARTMFLERATHMAFPTAF